MKSLTKNNEGFISIIAIGIFALLMIFAISLQMTVIDTLQNLKNGQNYDSARDVADSTIEYLQDTLQKFSPGLNDSANCTFLAGKAQTSDPTLCSTIEKIMTGKNATVSVIVKGRSATADKLNSQKCGTGDCYVTPTPGTGDAGTNCDVYKPNVTVASTYNVDPTLVNTATVDQVNYACNWNKLTFGSSQTDRVAVPLYYDSSSLAGTPGQANNIVNPYQGTASKFYVRLRTPCVPCGQKLDNGTVRDCTGKDPVVAASVCNDTTERYVLDSSTDEIVVQWLISGLCGTDACGVMPIPKGASDQNKKTISTSSSLYESLINKMRTISTTSVSQFDVVDNKALAFDTNNYPSTVYLLQSIDPQISTELDSISKPVLTLFLSKPLLTKDKANIPYLEYQVLTDQPVGNSKSSLDVTVNVEGNNFHKTLTQEVQKALIDFAIHN